MSGFRARAAAVEAATDRPLASPPLDGPHLHFEVRSTTERSTRAFLTPPHVPKKPEHTFPGARPVATVRLSRDRRDSHQASRASADLQSHGTVEGDIAALRVHGNRARRGAIAATRAPRWHARARHRARLVSLKSARSLHVLMDADDERARTSTALHRICEFGRQVPSCPQGGAGARAEREADSTYAAPAERWRAGKKRALPRERPFLRAPVSLGSSFGGRLSPASFRLAPHIDRACRRVALGSQLLDQQRAIVAALGDGFLACLAHARLRLADAASSSRCGKPSDRSWLDVLDVPVVRRGSR